MAIDWIKIVL